MSQGALIVGSSVAGLQAALDLANSGIQVHLVESSPFLGNGGVSTIPRHLMNARLLELTKNPKVTVEVSTYRPFFILGEVKKPGQYPYVNAMTVEAAVAIAEGYSDRAKKRFVRLTTDYPVQPGDTIYVLERLF